MRYSWRISFEQRGGDHAAFIVLLHIWTIWHLNAPSLYRQVQRIRSQNHIMTRWLFSQVIGMTVMMFVVDYLSPFGYRARARESDEEPGNEFNLLNSLWFATASVLQQGPDNTPLAPSGRLLASAFWFFILILISTYTANLAAFFTSKYWCVYMDWCKHEHASERTQLLVWSRAADKRFHKGLSRSPGQSSSMLLE